MSAAAAQRRLKVNAEEDASKLKFPPCTLPLARTPRQRPLADSNATAFTSENADGTENEAVACLSVSEIKSIIETLSLSETRSDNPCVACPSCPSCLLCSHEVYSIFHKTNEYVKRFGRFTTETVTEANV